MAKKKKTKAKAAKKKTAKKAAKKGAKTTAKKAAKKTAKKAGKKKSTAKKSAAGKAKKAVGKVQKAGGKVKKAAGTAKKTTGTAKKTAGTAKKTAGTAKKAGGDSKPKTTQARAPRPAPAPAPAAEPATAAERAGDMMSPDVEGGEGSEEEEGSGPAPEVGQDAPRFELPVLNAPGESWSLDDQVGRNNVVLYFYPKDDTPGCTTEACTFQKDLPSYDATDTVVVGVSPDSIASHQKFANKYGLSFPLLSDVDHQVARRYGVWVKKNMYGRESMGIQRATFLIDKQGRIARAWPKVKVEGHSAEVLEALQSL